MVRGLADKARDQGLLDEFLSALRTTDLRLNADPGEFGEVNYHLKYMGLEVRHAVVGFLSVHFAVDAVRFLVYVQKFEISSLRPR